MVLSSACPMCSCPVIFGGGITMTKGSLFYLLLYGNISFPSICCKSFLYNRGVKILCQLFHSISSYFFHFTVNQKKPPSNQRTKARGTTLFPVSKTDTLSSDNGTSRFAYPEISSEIPFSKATPKLPSTFFLQRIFQPMNPSLCIVRMCTPLFLCLSQCCFSFYISRFYSILPVLSTLN